MSITYHIEICNGKIENFSAFVEEIFKAVTECGKTIVREQLEALDDELMQSRDSKRYRNKGSRKTAVKTKLGTVEYTRRIYLDAVEKKHVFLLDEEIATHSVGLYDETICNNIEEMICNQSFQPSPYRNIQALISRIKQYGILFRAWVKSRLRLCMELPKAAMLKARFFMKKQTAIG